MRVTKRGHEYWLVHRDTKADDTIDETFVRFVNKEPGHERSGVTSQEVLRMLIDRTHYCNNCLPHRVNEEIIHHLRMALVLHESRALERDVERGLLKPEFVIENGRGHFQLESRMTLQDEEVHLKPTPPVGDRGQEPCHGCTSTKRIWEP